MLSNPKQQHHSTPDLLLQQPPYEKRLPPAWVTSLSDLDDDVLTSKNPKLQSTHWERHVQTSQPLKISGIYQVERASVMMIAIFTPACISCVMEDR